MGVDGRSVGKGAARATLLGLLVASSCLPPGEADGPRGISAPGGMDAQLGRELRPRESGEAAVVLVVLDGARWQEVFGGTDERLAASAGVAAMPANALLPHIYQLLQDRGAALGAPGCGASIAASGPNFVSLPGYSEIFTGRRAHACADNQCSGILEPTIADEILARTPFASDVAVIASWERIERVASSEPARLVVSAGRSQVHGAGALRDDEATRDALERGARADAFPGGGDFRPDRFTAALALRYLEAKKPRFLFLGLGEPDEYAHRGDYAGYLASLRAADAAIGELFSTLDRMGPRGEHTVVFVTADHGRARDYRVHGRPFPESARVWLVAAGAGVRARGMAHAEGPHWLADVAPTIRLLLDLPADVAPSSGRPLDELLAPPLQTMAMRP